MTKDEYGPSKWGWVATQVEEFEASGGKRANTLLDTGLAIIVMTTVGHKSGLIRKVPLMRVEQGGEYAIIASKGGAGEHPGWYHNLVADPNVKIQDGADRGNHGSDSRSVRDHPVLHGHIEIHAHQHFFPVQIKIRKGDFAGFHGVALSLLMPGR